MFEKLFFFFLLYETFIENKIYNKLLSMKQEIKITSYNFKIYNKIELFKFYKIPIKFITLWF
jgi:hypothetical protein